MPRLALRPLSLVAILFLMAAIVGAQAPVPTTEDQEIARTVIELLERGHMARPVIDDEISEKWCDNFIKDLDPQKYYFLKADVEEFKKSSKDLDDQVREGNINFARTVFERYLQRQDERYKTVTELLQKPMDFTVDEFLADDPDKIDYAVDKAEADERWRKKLKYEQLQLRIDGSIEPAEVVQKLTVRYRDRNRLFHQFDSSELLEVYLSSLTRTFDPHSSYLSAKNLEDMLNQQLHLSLEGIGASLRSEDGYAVVAEVVPGMAADKDGRLQPDDKIVAIRKDEGGEIDLVEKKLSDVVRYIRGPRGTTVHLIVQPAGTKERKEYSIVREKVELTEQHAKGKVLDSEVDGKAIKLGVINLPAFYGDTMAILRGDPNAVSATADCRKLLGEFKQAGVDAVIVDLRDNGGGLLEEAKTLSGLFIDTGPVVQIKEVVGVKHLDDDDDGTAWDGPLAVLINKSSASASEIFAGVIRDYGRGLIIGDSSTFGKGTVQSIVNIGEHARRRDRTKNRGALKLTIQQFFRANGDSTQINGVAPHIHIPSIRDYMDVGEGKMDNALKFEKVAPLAHDNYNRTPDDLVAALEARSAERRKADPKFQKLDERIKLYVERKAKHSIPLDEAKFKAVFVPDDEEKADDEKEKKDKKAKKKYIEREVWMSDFYNDEVLRIVGDYLTLGSKVLAAAPVRAAAVNE
ncbi:carboxy terminal-processing peptidase [Planctomyces sp. SH-PL62]|uniref:carboxy terminal-processing peptidase n=1 Tax=Planctomyces sp. SH-PL62 TaxID=1636152 RepID=UPI00078C530E|nr:carboxy terminal-processing peptidase [Planctomyces sp. SH-PL62]AMV38519.1 Tail-specific protease precursor [Planctomyces sp. SH-PL62]